MVDCTGGWITRLIGEWFIRKVIWCSISSYLSVLPVGEDLDTWLPTQTLWRGQEQWPAGTEQWPAGTHSGLYRWAEKQELRVTVLLVHMDGRCSPSRPGHVGNLGSSCTALAAWSKQCICTACSDADFVAGSRAMACWYAFRAVSVGREAGAQGNSFACAHGRSMLTFKLHSLERTWTRGFRRRI
jgi:hypothetical protein